MSERGIAALCAGLANNTTLASLSLSLCFAVSLSLSDRPYVCACVCACVCVCVSVCVRVRMCACACACVCCQTQPCLVSHPKVCAGVACTGHGPEEAHGHAHNHGISRLFESIFLI